MATQEALLYDSPEAFDDYCAGIAARLASRQQERIAFLRRCEARLLQLRAAAELLEVGAVRSELQQHVDTLDAELNDMEALPVAGGPREPPRAAAAVADAAPAPGEPPAWDLSVPGTEGGPLEGLPPEPVPSEAVSVPSLEPFGAPLVPDGVEAISPPGSEPVDAPAALDGVEPEPKSKRFSRPSPPFKPPAFAQEEKPAVEPEPAAEEDHAVIEAPVFSALEGSQLAGFPEPELPGDRAGATWGLTWIPHSARQSAPADVSSEQSPSPAEAAHKAGAPEAPTAESLPPDVTQVVPPRPAPAPSLRLASTGMMDWDLSHIRGAAQGSVSVDVPGAAPLRLEIQVGERRWNWTHQGGIAVIGRRDPHGPSSPDVDLWPDGGVSRGHAQIALRDGAYYLTDLGSTNGTQINGTGLIPRADVLLNDGDEILIGEDSTLCVRI